MDLMFQLWSGCVSSKTDEDSKNLIGKRFHSLINDMHTGGSKIRRYVVTVVPAQFPAVALAFRIRQLMFDASLKIEGRLFLEFHYCFHRFYYIVSEK